MAELVQQGLRDEPREEEQHDDQECEMSEGSSEDSSVDGEGRTNQSIQVSSPQATPQQSTKPSNPQVTNDQENVSITTQPTISPNSTNTTASSSTQQISFVFGGDLKTSKQTYQTPNTYQTYDPQKTQLPFDITDENPVFYAIEKHNPYRSKEAIELKHEEQTMHKERLDELLQSRHPNNRGLTDEAYKQNIADAWTVVHYKLKQKYKSIYQRYLSYQELREKHFNNPQNIDGT